MDFEGDPHQIFRNFREFVETQKPDAILLAEVDLDPNQYNKYLGNEDQMHMLFNFYVNNFMYLAFAREEATPLARALQRMPQEITEKEQLATFLRNHDELNLDKLSRNEREEVFKVFAPDENMRIFGRGIRRRLASILGNDRKKIELAHSLLFTLPGTPVLRYGEEIGMGEDLSMEGRSSVRTVMQWSKEKNGGFSTAPEEKLIRNIISGGEFGYEKVNVSDQLRDPDSLLTWISKAIDYRKEFPEFGWGRNRIIDTGNPFVLGHYTRSSKGMGVAFHNFSGKEITVKLEIDKEEFKNVVDVFGNIRYEDFDPENPEVRLTPYGYRWMHEKHNYL